MKEIAGATEKFNFYRKLRRKGIFNLFFNRKSLITITVQLSLVCVKSAFKFKTKHKKKGKFHFESKIAFEGYSIAPQQ